MSPRSCRSPCAFTMIEVLASMLVISVMFGAVIKLVSVSRTGRADAADRLRAEALASVLMGEVADQPFADPSSGSSMLGPDPGETARSMWNDVDDYAGYTQSPPTDRVGNVLADSTWSWNVSVNWVDPLAPTSVSASATTSKRISVSVLRNGRTLCTLYAVRTQGVTR